MKCPKCGIDAMITDKKLGFEGDDDPEKQTKAFYTFTYGCRNQACSEYGKEIDKTKVYL